MGLFRTYYNLGAQVAQTKTFTTLPPLCHQVESRIKVLRQTHFKPSLDSIIENSAGAAAATRMQNDLVRPLSTSVTKLMMTANMMHLNCHYFGSSEDAGGKIMHAKTNAYCFIGGP